MRRNVCWPQMGMLPVIKVWVIRTKVLSVAAMKLLGKASIFQPCVRGMLCIRWRFIMLLGTWMFILLKRKHLGAFWIWEPPVKFRKRISTWLLSPIGGRWWIASIQWLSLVMMDLPTRMGSGYRINIVTALVQEYSEISNSSLQSSSNPAARWPSWPELCYYVPKTSILLVDLVSARFEVASFGAWLSFVG